MTAPDPGRPCVKSLRRPAQPTSLKSTGFTAPCDIASSALDADLDALNDISGLAAQIAGLDYVVSISTTAVK